MCSTDNDFSIVIPFNNERENLHFLLSRPLEIFVQSPTTNIILVDNGSTDNSRELFSELLASDFSNKISLIYVPVNKGYGYGIMQGVLAAETEVIAWCHSDLQTDPMDVIKAYQLYRSLPQGLKIVKGVRKKRRLLDAYFTACMSVFASFALDCKLNDINAQPKLFDRSFLKITKDDYPYDFSLDLYSLHQAHKHKCSVYTYPVFFDARIHGNATGRRYHKKSN